MKTLASIIITLGLLTVTEAGRGGPVNDGLQNLQQQQQSNSVPFQYRPGDEEFFRVLLGEDEPPSKKQKIALEHEPNRSDAAGPSDAIGVPDLVTPPLAPERRPMLEEPDEPEMGAFQQETENIFVSRFKRLFGNDMKAAAMSEASACRLDHVKILQKQYQAENLGQDLTADLNVRYAAAGCTKALIGKMTALVQLKDPQTGFSLFQIANLFAPTEAIARMTKALGPAANQVKSELGDEQLKSICQATRVDELFQAPAKNLFVCAKYVLKTKVKRSGKGAASRKKFLDAAKDKPEFLDMFVTDLKNYRELKDMISPEKTNLPSVMTRERCVYSSEGPFTAWQTLCAHAFDLEYAAVETVPLATLENLLREVRAGTDMKRERLLLAMWVLKGKAPKISDFEKLERVYETQNLEFFEYAVLDLKLKDDEASSILNKTKAILAKKLVFPRSARLTKFFETVIMLLQQQQ